MTACPELVVLEARAWSPEVSAHISGCGSCRLVMELIDERSQAAASRERRVECAKFEALLAVRVAGGIGTTASGLLDEHLEACDDCRAIADTMAPDSDRRTDQMTLATIERSAYALGVEVARGGMGRVLSARDLRIGRPVALKELLGSTSAQAARFEREARVTARLQHPGIVPIYEIGRWSNGTPFYSMRMVAGRTLRAALAHCNTLAQRLAFLPAVVKGCEAVAFAHANHVIHRDLTPSNIMVGEYGDIVVIDWGLAKDLADDPADDIPDAGPYRGNPHGGEGLTVDGAVIGTASYMPPEQAAGKRVDARADVYALGAILYHLLAGQAPYRGRNEVVLAAVTAGPPPPIDIAGAPRDLVSIVAKAMARAPADRYASAGELASELAAFQAGRLVEAHRYSRGELVRRWIRRHRAAVIVSMIASCVLLGGGVLALANIMRERDRAEAGQRDAVSQRQISQRAATKMLVEFGREHLLAGEAPQAAAYLSEAYANGETSSELRFLLGSAMSSLDAIDHVLVGASEPVRSLGLSADRKRLLVIRASTVEQWSIADGKRLATLGAAHVTDGAYAGDGRTIVTLSDDGAVRIWGAETGDTRRTLAAPGTVRVALSDDGARVLTVDGAGLAKTWSTTTGALLETVSLGRVHAIFVMGRLVVGASVAPDPKLAVIRDWQVGKQFEIAPPMSGDGDVNDDGSRVVICGSSEVGLWDNTSRLLHTWQVPQVIGCRFDASKQRVMAEDARGTARIWDIATGDQLGEVSLADGPTRGILVGDRIVSGLNTANIAVRDAETGSVIATYPSTEKFPTTAAPDAVIVATNKLVVPRADGSIAIVDLAGGRSLRRQLGSTHPNESLLAVQNTLVVTTANDKVLVRDLRDGRLLATLGKPVAIADGGSKFAGMTSDRTVTIFDARSAAPFATMELDERPDDLDLDRAGDRLLVVRHGGPIETWALVPKSRVASRPAVPPETEAHITPDGSHLLILSSAQVTLERLDGTDPHVLAEHPLDLVFSGDGKRMALSDGSSVGGGTPEVVISVVNLATGQRISEIKEDTLQLALDGDGDVLATLGGDKIDIWSVSTHTLLRTIRGNAGTGPALSADGTLVATDSGVWSAIDGRQLSSTVPLRRPGELANTLISTESPSVVSFALAPHGDVTMWAMPNETRSPTEIQRILAERSPWRLELGELVER